MVVRCGQKKALIHARRIISHAPPSVKFKRGDIRLLHAFCACNSAATLPALYRRGATAPALRRLPCATTGVNPCALPAMRNAHHRRTTLWRLHRQPARLCQRLGGVSICLAVQQALCASRPTPVDLIVPMPLGPARLRERGFNQALELARVASVLTNTPLSANACRRVQDRAPQAMLPWRERAKNIRGAFVYNTNLSGLRVAVVDDVMTTGATLNELARTLRKAGATEVHGWMVGRTLKQG